MENIIAIWRPAWHELDQSLQVGIYDTYFLDQTTQPARFATWLDDNVSEVKATIRSIYNSELGDITRIDTHGLSYTFYSGSELISQIEAEENTGFIEQGLLQGQHLVDLNFKVVVELRQIA